MCIRDRSSPILRKPARLGWSSASVLIAVSPLSSACRDGRRPGPSRPSARGLAYAAPRAFLAQW
eukprot:11822819-Alexandrium_andersonii.AAC.1